MWGSSDSAGDSGEQQPTPGDGAYTCAQCGTPVNLPDIFDSGFLTSEATTVYCSEACANG